MAAAAKVDREIRYRMTEEVDEVLGNESVDTDRVVVGAAEQSDDDRASDCAGDQPVDRDDRGCDCLRRRPLGSRPRRNEGRASVLVHRRWSSSAAGRRCRRCRTRRRREAVRKGTRFPTRPTTGRLDRKEAAAGMSSRRRSRRRASPPDGNRAREDEPVAVNIRPTRSGTLACSTYQSAPIMASRLPVIIPTPCSVISR